MPYWMWMGNVDTQYNSTPSTNLTSAEANSLIGYEASGPSELQAVMMNGQLQGGFFRTTFGSSGGTPMWYDSPALGGVTDTRITTAVAANIDLFDLDSSGNEVLLGRFLGMVVQMENGDMFFRPHINAVSAWSGLDRFYSMRIATVTRYDDAIAIDPTIGFNPDIVDIPIICFARNTLILTYKGEVAVENLQVGDLVVTRDRALQPIRWIGSRKLRSSELDVLPKLRPIRIKAGALGDGVPSSDLLVSPQHRVLVRSKIARKMFGTDEVLVAAKQLLLLDGIDIATDMQEVEYFHILFDRHEVVISNGAETESLFTGPEALKSVGKAALEEIFTLFPELEDPNYVPQPARFLPSGRKARKMGMRHLQNNLPLVATR